MLGLENWDGGLKSPQVQYQDNNIIHVTCTSITVGSGTSLSTISKQVLYVCLVIFRGTSVLWSPLGQLKASFSYERVVLFQGYFYTLQKCPHLRE